jgi:hypothetical protein
MVNVILAPAVLVGVLAGRWLLERIPQRLFEHAARLCRARGAQADWSVLRRAADRA